MAERTGTSRFLFRGHAIPLAGRIRRPNEYVIPAQAVSTTSVVGGRAQAVVNRPNLPEVVSIARAESVVEGDYDSPAEAVAFTHGNHHDNNLPTKTTVYAVVEDLRITNKGNGTSRTLTADKVEFRMMSVHPRNGEQPSIRIEHAAIDGLALDGYGLNVDLREKIFTEKDTRQKLCEAYEKDDKFFGECREMFMTPAGMPQPEAAGGGRKLPEAGGYTEATIVRNISWSGTPHPNATIDGNMIRFQDFGQIYIGELFLSDISRRLTMMRIHLGSPDGGELSVAEGESNGVSWPPV